MIASGRRIAGFVGLGALALGAILAVNQRTEWTDIDPRTGEVIVAVDRLVAQARSSGSVVAALDVLLPLGDLQHSPCPNELAVLLHELAAPGAAPLVLAKNPLVVTDAIRKDLEARDAVIAKLAGSPLVWGTIPLAEAVGVLLADGAIDAQTVDFFRPLAGGGDPGIDGEAARLQVWTPEQALDLSGRYLERSRPRAAARWALRAWAAEPTARDATRHLVRLLTDLGQRHGALRVAALGAEDDIVLGSEQAKLALWIGDTALEIKVLERLVARRDVRAEDRGRLMNLYAFAGDIEAAGRIARELAASSGTRESELHAIGLAMQIGDVHHALDAAARLRRAEQLLGTASFWQEFELDLLEVDYRFDDLEPQLKRLYASDPDKYGARYEALLRRLWSTDELAAVLVDRSEREPANMNLRQEAFARAARSGNPRLLSRLIDLVLRDGLDVAQALRAIRPMERLGVLDVSARISAALRGTKLNREEALDAFHALRYAAADEELLDALVDATFEQMSHVEVRKEMIEALEVAAPGRGFSVFHRLHGVGAAEDDILKEWSQRARWVGDNDEMLASYGIMLERNPGEVAVRALRAEVYSNTRQHEMAFQEWRRVLEDAGQEPPFRWVEAAIVAAALAGRDDDVRGLAARYVEPDGGDIARAQAERVIADHLFDENAYRWASEFYASSLKVEPGQGSGLLRYAQALSGQGRLEEARAALERLQDQPVGQSPMARLLLADAWTTKGRTDDAQRLYREVADGIPATEWNRELLEWRTRALVGAGEFQEARVALEAYCTSAHPAAYAHLLLADVYHATGDSDLAVTKAQDYLVANPDHVDGLKVLARAQLGTGHPAAAVVALRRAVRFEGQSGGASVDLVDVLTAAGQWNEAAALAEKTALARPQDFSLARTGQRLREYVAPLFSPTTSSRRVADDSIYRQGLFCSVLLANERTRLTGSVELASYSGRSRAFRRGRSTIDSTVWHTRVGAEHRFSQQSTLGAGVHFYPLATGPGGAGFWADYQWASQSNSSLTVHARAHGGDLWETTAAAVGLGGRTSGLQVDIFRNLGERWFASADARYSEVSLHAGGVRSDSEALVEGRASLGYVVTAGQGMMAEPGSFERSGALGYSPYFGDRAARGHGHQLMIFGALDHSRLGGRGELSGILPIARDARYILLGGRLDLPLGTRAGGMLEVAVGTDLVTHDPTYSVDAGMTYRASHPVEVFIRGGFGQALSRGTDEEEYRLMFGLRLRP